MTRVLTAILAFFSIFSLLLIPLGPARADFPGQDKIVTPGLAEKALDSEGRIRVIVLLEGYKELSEIDFRGNKALLDSHQKAVAVALDSALDKLDPQKCLVGLRFENILGFTASVTPGGLAQLAALDEVAVIEEDRLLRLQTAQGIPQMNPTVYRSRYGGQGVAIALVDSGADYSHPALGGGGFPNAKVIGGWDIAGNSADPRDTLGHGTATAAIAAGINTGAGDYIGGVAPQAKIYALKVADSAGRVYSGATVRAWDWCVSHQADNSQYPIKIISNSLGSQGAYSSNPCDAQLPSYTTAASNAVANGMAIFVSSGNDGACGGISGPACLSNAISVGSVYDAGLSARAYCVGPSSCVGTYNSSCYANYGYLSSYACQDASPGRDQVPCYSDSGPGLDLLAPSNCAYAPRNNNSYYTCFGGTSAACPYAAGAAAVLQSWAKTTLGRFLTVAELKNRLVNNGDTVTDAKSGLAKPRINITRAVANSGPGTGGGGTGGTGCASATRLGLNTSVNASIGSAGENDYFRLNPTSAGSLTVYTTGSTDTYGYLLNSACQTITYNDDISYPSNLNFRISRQVTAGTYYVRVRHYSSTRTGPYTLYVGFGSGGGGSSGGQARWGLYTTLCCSSGATVTFTGQLGGQTRSSSSYGCSGSPTWEGYAAISPGSGKTFYYRIYGCGVDYSNSRVLSTDFQADTCYFFRSSLSGEYLLIQLYRISSCVRPFSLEEGSGQSGEERLEDEVILPLRRPSPALRGD